MFACASLNICPFLFLWQTPHHPGGKLFLPHPDDSAPDDGPRAMRCPPSGQHDAGGAGGGVAGAHARSAGLHRYVGLVPGGRRVHR